MEREEAKNYMREHAADVLQPARREGWICPICGSGSGPNGTGITSDNGIHFTCWARGCFTHEDIIDILGRKEGAATYGQKLEAAARAFGIQIDGAPLPRAAGGKNPFSLQAKNQGGQQAQGKKQEEAPVDYSSYYRECEKRLEQTNYHRGISLETLRRFHVGYDPSWKHPKVGPNIPNTPRLIIPTSKWSYIARDAREVIPAGQETYKKMKTSPANIFNVEALEQKEEPVFIVEGEIDAMSIYDVGGQAVGLGSLSMAKKFIEAAKNKKPLPPLIVFLDNEKKKEGEKEGGAQKTAAELTRELEALGAHVLQVEYQEGRPKDANEWLTTDRAGFTEFIQATEQEAREQAKEKQEAAREVLRAESAGRRLQQFISDIQNSKTAPFIPTGFPKLDELLDGGLRPGLYVIGAVSSIGKTTFVVQMADQIAQAAEQEKQAAEKEGRPLPREINILFFSLEMAARELIAKSLSRLTHVISEREGGEYRGNAKTVNGILTGKNYDSYSETEKRLITAAQFEYSAYAHRIFYKEGMGEISAATIREEVERFTNIMGAAPVVFIDYAQILAPMTQRATDKQAVDDNIKELKRISRDYSTPVIAVSSFNRANYWTGANLAAFKESGAIEYGSDLLIALQLDGMDKCRGENDGDKKAAGNAENIRQQANLLTKQGKPINVQVKVLKNRNGSCGDFRLGYWRIFNRFDVKPAAKDPLAELLGR